MIVFSNIHYLYKITRGGSKNRIITRKNFKISKKILKKAILKPLGFYKCKIGLNWGYFELNEYKYLSRKKISLENLLCEEEYAKTAKIIIIFQ